MKIKSMDNLTRTRVKVLFIVQTEFGLIDEGNLMCSVELAIIKKSRPFCYYVSW